MTQYDNTNRGVFFRSDRKASASHPDFKGSINVDGREFWLSIWTKQGAKGEFFSASIQPKDGQSTAQSASMMPRPYAGRSPQGKEPSVMTDRGAYSLDDDIPF